VYAKGIRAYFKKDYAAAVKYLKEYVSRNQKAKAYYFLGYAQYELKGEQGVPRAVKIFGPIPRLQSTSVRRISSTRSSLPTLQVLGKRKNNHSQGKIIDETSAQHEMRPLFRR